MVFAGGLIFGAMKRFLQGLMLVGAVVCGHPALANSANNRLQAVASEHEQLATELPSDRMARLMRRYRPTDDQGGMFTRAFLKTVPAAQGGKEWRCLAEALYFEARGETIEGQFAVAEVILNRVESGKFPDTICGVVNQGSGNGRYRCQFTYTCDGKLEIISEKKAWESVGKVAMLAIEGDVPDLTHGATFYHTTYVSPSWSRKFARTITIGEHHFYREPERLSSR
jgi:spore germination cell wall hydrolase CwlJ-like protein